MSGVVYLDTSPIVYAAQAGGVDLLNSIANYWQARGYNLAITDAVVKELGLATPSPAFSDIQAWLYSKGIPPTDTSFGGANFSP